MSDAPDDVVVNTRRGLDSSRVTRSEGYRDYLRALSFIAVWVAAVLYAVWMIESPRVGDIWKQPEYSSRLGYTHSLALLYLPLTFLLGWYYRSRDVLQLRGLMRALLRIVAVTAGGWILLDIFFANLFFTFPDARAHLQLTLVPGYKWTGECNVIWTLWRFPDCYFPRSIPLEEFVFYLGGAALLTMMYMWASEDFYSAYTMPREEYTEQAKQVGPLVEWNWKLIVIGVATLAVGIMIKKWGWWHDYHEGWPTYLLAELIIVFVPLSALYTRVHRFTNPHAFIFVMLLHIHVSLLWEATLAVPHGWWNYQPAAMMGLFVAPWSFLAIEAPGLWLSVGWATLFIYETMKIKVVTGKTWRQVLFG